MLTQSPGPARWRGMEDIAIEHPEGGTAAAAAGEPRLLPVHEWVTA